jgi:hypothetical protein
LGACFPKRTEEGFDPMSEPDTVEQRKLRSIARRYKREGYRVTIPAQGGTLPSFLEGFAPDLIAESEHDRVIVEIKQNYALRGSNDLQEVAERVAREPGWRFELVTVPTVENASPPAAQRMDFIADRARQVMSAGLTDLAYMYVWAVIEVLLSDLALQNGLKMTKTSIAQVGHDLVSLGVISRDALDAIEQARAIRNRVVHAENVSLPSAAEVENLLALARHLRGELVAAAAA